MKKKWGKRKTRCKCLSCGKIFFQYIYPKGHDSGKYCTRACYYTSLIGRKLSLVWIEKIRQSNIKTKAKMLIKPLDRFWAKVEKTDTCWNWLGGKSHNGYGVMYLNEKRNQIRVSRYSYEIHKGKIAEGLTIDHLCSNRKCVNPEHLEVVSQGINTLRGGSPSAMNARKLFCKRGHSFTGFYKNQRYCKTCKKLIRASYRNRRSRKTNKKTE